MTHSNSKYMFLSRPRRFGKSLLTSTLRTYCGITEEEMRMQMDADLDAFAGKTGMDKEQLVEKLKSYYDGYHFTWPSPDIYNPYSLMNAFGEGELNAYWFGSGTPIYLIEMLRKFHVMPQQIGGRKVRRENFDAPVERMTNVTPLLYQSGYLTIKDYIPYSVALSKRLSYH